ncbi:unnamed protein product [Durusdinium trenchii]|uniref:Uncharacterized protein n=1 Tax=Durusdinium trenchii TaxID=1381693 RepID=A0ABP0S1F7_9DINO
MPVRLWGLVQVIMKAFPPPPRKYKNVDLFAGKCAISRSFKAQGYATCSMDIEINELDDILSPVGFIRTLYAAIHIARGGLCTMGVVCSSFTQINRGTSGRTAENPLGREHYPSVAKANLMLVRAVLIMITVLHFQGHWMLENPLSSIIDLMPRFRKLLDNTVHHRCHTWLGMFKAPTPKPIKLYSDDPFVQHLHRTLDRSRFAKSDTTIKYKNRAGQTRFRGSATLKASQVYPGRFGREVLHAWETYARERPNRMQLLDFSNDPWEDAQLSECEAWLETRIQERASKSKETLMADLAA